MVLESNQNRLAISILDYEESTANNQADRNALLTSIEILYEGRSTIVTAPVISTYELPALADWFEQVAAGEPLDPVVLQEPCLFFTCSECTRESFRIWVRLEAEASPIWTNYYAEPFAMDFWLTPNQMRQTAHSLRQLHQNFPTQD